MKIITKVLFISLISFSISNYLCAENSNKFYTNPVKSEHLKNFHKVSDKLYRSAQPDKLAFKELEKNNFEVVLNLRQYHSDKDEAKGCKIKLKRIKMNAGDIDTKSVIKALKIINNAKGKVLIHCWHGSDRTGTIIAMYRIVFENWSKKDAINELIHGGFGYHSIYDNIPEFILNCNVKYIKNKVFNK